MAKILPPMERRMRRTASPRLTTRKTTRSMMRTRKMMAKVTRRTRMKTRMSWSAARSGRPMTMKTTTTRMTWRPRSRKPMTMIDAAATDGGGPPGCFLWLFSGGGAGRALIETKENVVISD